MGLLSPVTVGYDDEVTDAAILDALVTVEVALVRAYGALGVAPASVVEAVDQAFADGHGIDAAALAAASVAGGNPVIPLVGLLKDRVPGRGAPVGAPRRDEPGHPRLRPDAGRPRARRSGSWPRSARSRVH